MIEENSELTSSDKYLKKSNRIILLVGILALFIFIIGMTFIFSGDDNKATEEKEIDLLGATDPFAVDITSETQPIFETEVQDLSALVINPSEIILDKVNVGGTAEATVTLMADTGKQVKISSFNFEDLQNNGFEVIDKCAFGEVISGDISCDIIVIWRPTQIMQVQTNLVISWMEEGSSIPVTNKSIVSINAISNDSECTTACDPINVTGGNVTPEIIALDLSNNVIGTVNSVGDVINNNAVIGNVIGDGTIVFEGKIIGRAVNIGSVIDKNGVVIGQIKNDGTVTDATENAIGTVRFDGSVINTNGAEIGYSIPKGIILGFDNKVIGKISETGKIINAADAEIGNILPDGSAVSNGNKIGNIMPQGVAVGESCRFIGYVDNNATIVDNSSRSYGRVLASGLVVDKSEKPIGEVIKQGAVISNIGDYIGFVNNQGKVIDNAGNVIGCMNPSGKAISIVDGKIIGGLIPHTGVVGSKCSRIGFVFPTGDVISSEGEIVGKVLPNGDVVNSAMEKLGVAVPKYGNSAMNVRIGADVNMTGTLFSTNTAIGDNCTVVGKVDSYGRIFNDAGVEIACLSDDMKFTEPSSGKEVAASLLGSGIVFDVSGKFIGTTNFEGKMLDEAGNIVGCLDSNLNYVSNGNIQGSAVEKIIGTGTAVLNTPANDGVVGNSTAAVGIDGNVYTNDGETIGKILQGGVAIANDGIVIGNVAEESVVVSNSGEKVGKIDINGSVLDNSGNVMGRVISDDTVISVEGDVIGFKIAIDTILLSIEGEVIGKINAEGKAVDSSGNVIGTVRADKMLVDANGVFIGGVMPRGHAVDVYGNILGTVADDGTVVNNGTPIGQVLLNGTVINSSLNVIGQVIEQERIFIDNKGDVAGTVLIDGKVINRFFEQIGTANAFGTVFDKSKNIIGGAVKEAIVLNKFGNVEGYIIGNKAFNLSGTEIGKVLNNGLVLDMQSRPFGSVIQSGTVVDYNGKWLGVVAPNGSVTSAGGTLLGHISPDGYLRDDQGNVTGKLIPNGLIVGNNGSVYGALMPDASILLPSGSAEGYVFPEGIAVSSSAEILGSLIPYGSLAVNNKGEIIGVLDYDNNIASIGKYNVRGNTLNNNLIIDKSSNSITGSIKEQGQIALDFNGNILGFINANAMVVGAGNDVIGSIASGNVVVDKYGKVIGGVVPTGMAIGNDGKFMGIVAFDGSIASKQGAGSSFVTSTGKVSDGNRILGEVVEFGVAAASNGKILGTAHPDGNVRDFTENVIGKVLFDDIFTDGTGNYLGGIMQMGVALNSSGSVYGYVARDGYVYSADGRIMARALPDGTVAAVNNKSNYAIVPTVAYLAKPGMAVLSSDNSYAGFVFPDGNVIDAYGNIKGTTNRYNIVSNQGQDIGPIINLDTAMGQGCRVIGIASPLGQAVDIASGSVIGDVNANRNVIDSMNEVIGGIKLNGPVFDNNCKQLGYVAPNGSVIDLRGQVIGCANYDGSIINTSGSMIGRVVPEMIVNGLEGKIHKILNNGQVVDDAGVMIGCLKSDNTIVNAVGDTVDTLIEQKYYAETTQQMPTASGMPFNNVNQGPAMPFNQAQNLAYGGGPIGGNVVALGGDVVDPVAVAALQAAQMARRGQMGMASIKPSKKMLKKALGIQDWSGIGIEKNIMSNPVKMNRVILKGKAIPAVLSRSVDSRFGEVPLEAYVDRNIYAEDGREILIPSGSRLIGSLGSAGGGNKVIPKLTISWERLVRPDGASFAFETNASSGDSQGRGGVPGYLDMQLLRKYGLPLLETVLTSAITYGMAAWDDDSVASYASDTGEPILTSKQQAAQDARDNFRTSMEQVFQDIIAETSTVPPVVFIPSGTRITVFANDDLWVVPSHWDEDMEDEEGVDDIPLGGKDEAKNESKSATSSGGGVSATYQPSSGGGSYSGSSYGGGGSPAPVYTPSGGGGGSDTPRLF